jgi:hypothetical protein
MRARAYCMGFIRINKFAAFVTPDSKKLTLLPKINFLE